MKLIQRFEFLFHTSHIRTLAKGVHCIALHCCTSTQIITKSILFIFTYNNISNNALAIVLKGMQQKYNQ
jgi:hypothetical protein